MKNILLWILALVAFLFAIGFAGWAVQGLWLSGFMPEASRSPYAINFYIRSGASLALLLATIWLAFKAWAGRNKISN